jgi:UDP-glucose 4-epimerase
MVEEILRDMARAIGTWQAISLRYFNPVGAHVSGLIGEDPRDTPNNLMPYVAQVAVGRLPCLRVFGDDYPTSDGTGVRDYVHVTDLAKGHVAAISRLFASLPTNYEVVNLGTGRGFSVLEVVRAFTEVSGRTIPFEIVERRQGDIATALADASLAEQALNWRPERDLRQMCADAWRWQSGNPNGYRTRPSD